jgi:pyruvate/oxaloacetate carboxyltransferase
MKTEDMLPVAEKMDSIGFCSMEVRGGATFDVMIKLQMLLGGQNLAGY